MHNDAAVHENPQWWCHYPTQNLVHTMEPFLNNTSNRQPISADGIRTIMTRHAMITRQLVHLASTPSATGGQTNSPKTDLKSKINLYKALKNVGCVGSPRNSAKRRARPQNAVNVNAFQRDFAHAVSFYGQAGRAATGSNSTIISIVWIHVHKVLFKDELLRLSLSLSSSRRARLSIVRREVPSR